MSTTRTRTNAAARRVIPPLAALACLIAAPSLTGLITAAVIGWSGHRLLNRTPRTATHDSAWAWSLYLLAAGLRAGRPLSHTAIHIADTANDDVSDRLRRFGTALALGADAHEAGRHLTGLTRRQRVVTAVERSRTTGASLSATLENIASGINLAHNTTVNERAATTGVHLLAPMFLCFLPAFVLLGIIPTVAALLTGLEAW
ncbi:type II secretion system F family protein [Haloglycomyces albus]|uniref:type II secretion system F family protein n=1 Tax=Haloglycomyces albus TaxID=526067 RepID=UPI0004B068E5|nr:type II secretion system F family protein [Haloglycomyces albus]